MFKLYLTKLFIVRFQVQWMVEHWLGAEACTIRCNDYNKKYFTAVLALYDLKCKHVYTLKISTMCKNNSNKRFKNH